MQNEKIKFKPLHDGVGFHPFSEGLPYAPQVKTASKPEPKTVLPSISPSFNRGAGATVAGTPTFATPKTTRQLQQTANAQSATTPTFVAKSEPVATTVPVQESVLLRARFFAYLLDTVMHLGFWIGVDLLGAFLFHFQLDASLLARNWVGFSIFFAFSQWFFIAMQELLFETSFGKSFFGLEFKQTRKSFFASSLFLRSIVFMLGTVCLGLGLIYRPQDRIAEIQFKRP